MKNIFTLETNQKILKACGIYSLLWGFLITFAPRFILRVFNVELLFGVEFWQLFGLFVGAAGIGYCIASTDPGKYWLTVFVGYLGHLLGTFIFAKSLLMATLPYEFAMVLFLSTAVWVIPFYYILIAAYEEHAMETSSPKKFHDLISFVRTSQNKTLLELSQKQNVLLVFVRHFGCTFCRETVSEMAKLDKSIAGKNYSLVFVHMSDPSFGDEFFSKYYDHPVHHISDPGRALYQSLSLKRGSLSQLFGPMVWIRGIYAGIFKGHGIGEFQGDTLQLGGVFVLSNGQIVFEEKAKSASHIIQFNSLPEL